MSRLIVFIFAQYVVLLSLNMPENIQYSQVRVPIDSIDKPGLIKRAYCYASIEFQKFLQRRRRVQSVEPMPTRGLGEQDDFQYLKRLKKDVAKNHNAYLQGSGACYPNRFLDWSSRYLNIEQQVVLAEHLYFALHATGDLKRHNSQPYFTHLIAVSMIKTMADQIMEREITGASMGIPLLHDLVEDTDITSEKIETYFGEKTRRIVDALSETTFEMDKSNEELARIEVGANRLVSGGIDVILIKIADRIHNMRTIRYVEDAKKVSKALDTYFVVAQLAEIIGHPYKFELFRRVEHYLPEKYITKLFIQEESGYARKELKDKWSEALRNLSGI